MASKLPRTTTIVLDTSNTPALESAIAAHDLLISLILYMFHAAVVSAAIKCHTRVVTIFYVSPLCAHSMVQAGKASIIVFDEIGVEVT